MTEGRIFELLSKKKMTPKEELELDDLMVAEYGVEPLVQLNENKGAGTRVKNISLDFTAYHECKQPWKQSDYFNPECYEPD